MRSKFGTFKTKDYLWYMIERQTNSIETLTTMATRKELENGKMQVTFTLAEIEEKSEMLSFNPLKGEEAIEDYVSNLSPATTLVERTNEYVTIEF